MTTPHPFRLARSRTKDLTPEDRGRIQELATHGYGSRAIAKRLSLSRKIVRQALDNDLPGAAGPAGSRACKLDPFREAIEQRVQQGLTVCRILREIRDLGYRGGRTQLGLLVGQLRVGMKLPGRRTAKRRFETQPGEEMQVDWSPATVPIAGRPTRVHVLGVILAYSRRLFIGLYRDERESTLLEGLARSFEYFEGCARRCVFDNMATVTLGRHGPGRKPLWHPRFLEFARHYGFEPYLCTVADPDRKGKIEKSFRLVFDDFLKGATFESFDDLDRRARVWLDQTPGVGNLRHHGTTGRVPNEAWLAERDLLISLPAQRLPVYEETVRAVDQDATISVKNLRYSVPSRLAGRQATVRLFADHFEVFDGRGLLQASHRYADPGTHPGKLVIDPSHYAGLARRPSAGLDARQLDQAFARRFPALSPLADGLKRTLKGIANIHLRHLLRLSESYGLDAFVAAARQAQEHRCFNAHAVQRILERDHPFPPEGLQPVLCGLGPALLGEVEEGDLDTFAHLDRQQASKEPVAGDL